MVAKCASVTWTSAEIVKKNYNSIAIFSARVKLVFRFLGARHWTFCLGQTRLGDRPVPQARTSATGAELRITDGNSLECSEINIRHNVVDPQRKQAQSYSSNESWVQ